MYKVRLTEFVFKCTKGFTVTEFKDLFIQRGRRGDLMVSALVSGSSGPGSSPGRGHCVVFLGKTITLTAGGNPAMDWHPIQGGVEILLVASFYRNRDKFRPDGPNGSYVDLTLP